MWQPINENGVMKMSMKMAAMAWLNGIGGCRLMANENIVWHNLL
jgi:hypothetical protein